MKSETDMDESDAKIMIDAGGQGGLKAVRRFNKSRKCLSLVRRHMTDRIRLTVQTGIGRTAVGLTVVHLHKVSMSIFRRIVTSRSLEQRSKSFSPCSTSATLRVRLQETPGLHCVAVDLEMASNIDVRLDNPGSQVGDDG